MKPIEFINRISPDATHYWHRSKVPASLIIAQAALESNWGSSALTLQANNLFGIKGEGPAGSIKMLTTEYRSGVAVKEYASFRKYTSWSQSLADHTALLLKKRYAAVINQTGKNAAYAVARAGYATDPNYAAKLIQLMDKYNLYQYDSPKGDEPMTAEEKELFDDLVKTVRMQGEVIAKLQKRAEIPIPDWAQEAVTAALNYDREQPLIQQPDQGSQDFYRLITIMHRRGLFKK